MVDVVAGLGVVGKALTRLLNDGGVETFGVDGTEGLASISGCDVLHVCFPYSERFVGDVVAWYHAVYPKEVVVHSTVKVGTTERLQKLLSVPVVFSPVRGVESRMLEDLRRYTKCWATYDAMAHFFFEEEMNKCGVKIGYWEDPRALELAKLLMDTTYYGWLICFAQHVKCLAEEYGVDEGQLWRFAEEIHELLGNRPEMFSGAGIGGHCVLPNLELLDDNLLRIIKDHDRVFRWGGCKQK